MSSTRSQAERCTSQGSFAAIPIKPWMERRMLLVLLHDTPVRVLASSDVRNKARSWASSWLCASGSLRTVLWSKSISQACGFATHTDKTFVRGAACELGAQHRCCVSNRGVVPLAALHLPAALMHGAHLPRAAFLRHQHVVTAYVSMQNAQAVDLLQCLCGRTVHTSYSSPCARTHRGCQISALRQACESPFLLGCTSDHTHMCLSSPPPRQ